MTRGTIIFLLLVTGMVVTLATVHGVSWAQESQGRIVRAEIIWSEDDGLRHEIYVNSMRDGTWGESTKLTDDNADNLHPSIDVGRGDTKWAAWTAVETGSMLLRYSFFDGKAWQEPSDIPSDLASNIKPSLLVDGEGTVWVVWAGNDGGLDDIYYSRYVDGAWDDAQPVHAANAVPDILPTLGFVASGAPEVRWQRYQDGDYRLVESAWDGEKWGDPVEVPEEDEVAEEQEALLQEIVLPEDLTDSRQAFIRVVEEKKNEPDEPSIKQ